MEITVTFNGHETAVLKSMNLLDFLESEGITDVSGIALAVNESVVPKKDWKDTIIKAKDSIIVIKATQGG